MNKIITGDEYRARVALLPKPKQLTALIDYAQVLADGEAVLDWNDVEIDTHAYPSDGWQIRLDEWQGGRIATIYNKRVITCCKNAALRYAIHQAYTDELAEYVINGHQIPECECESEEY